MSSLFVSGRFQGFDSSGDPLSGGLLYSYAAGTLTPLASYTTQAGDVANANPVVLDSAGRASVWLGAASYRMILKTSAGVTIWDTDNISGYADGDLSDKDTATAGAGLIGVRRGVDYPFDTAGFLLVRNGSPMNVFNAFTSKAEVEAVRAKTSTSDHYSILLDVLGNEQHVYFPYGRFNSSASLAMGSHAVSIDGVKGSEIRGTDGAYDLLSYTGAQRFHVRNITLRSTNTVNPALRLLKMSSAAAYFDVEGCQFVYGADGLVMDGCYVVRSCNNHFNNCDTFMQWTDASASVADFASLGDSFGTSNMGTDDLVKIDGPGAVMTQASFETQYLTKPSLHVLTGAQNFYLEGSFITSGEVIYDTSTGGIARIRAQNSYSSANNRFLRVAGGATLDISGSRMQQDTLVPGVVGVSCSGDLIAHGVQMYKWGTAISCSGAISLHGGQYSNNTTAISASGSGAIVEPVYAGNTTDATIGGTVVYSKTLRGTATFNPSSLADGAGETTTVTVTGAVLGDFAQASFAADLQGITVTAWVSAANTASVRFQNETGGPIDLASSTLRVVVDKK